MSRKPASRRRIAWALVCAAPLPAIAGDGWYLGLEGGANFLSDQSFKVYNDTGVLGILGGAPDGTEIAKTRADTGWLAGAVFGYAFSNGLRPELEYSYRDNGFKSVDLNSALGGGSSADADGSERLQAGFANLWFDFFKSGHLHPYLGGGVGYGQVKLDNPVYNNNTLRSADDTGLVYQGGAGVGIDLSYHWTLSLDYRYVSGDRSKFDLAPAATPVNSDTYTKARYEAQSAMLTLRYSFASPPPPPAPPPEPVAVVEAPPAPPPPPPPPCKAPEAGQKVDLSGCAAGDVIVLHGVNFEFDKATLTVNAKTLLDDVVAALQARPDIKVEIDGYTDSKGSDAYNQKLSERRAQSVVAYLTEHGIDAARLSAKGFGESSPVADNATDEGRELNRRVELRVTESQGPAPASSAPAADQAAPPAQSAAPADAGAAPATPTDATPPAEPTAPAEPAAPAGAVSRSLRRAVVADGESG